MSKKKLSPGAALARLRWDNPDADRNQPRLAGKLGGRPKLPRCPCQKMTQRIAERDGHVCEEVK